MVALYHNTFGSALPENSVRDYEALSAEGNLEFVTILKVMSALDLKIKTRVSS